MPAMDGGRLEWNRNYFPGVQDFVGKARRSPITGEVHLNNEDDLNDFMVVDLYHRSAPPADLHTLHKDPFLFRPVLMKYRTWMYHCFAHDEKVLPGDQNCMFEYVLSQWCIDAPTSSGRFSPLIAFVPISVSTCLTGELFLVLASLIVMCLTHAVGTHTNSPKLYRHARMITLLPRLLFFFYTYSRLQFDSALGALGSVLPLVCFLADILLGDVSTIRYWKLHCSHSAQSYIKRSRVCVAERHGAQHQEEMFGDRGHVDEEVSGFANWKHTNTLIADINGLILELRPLQSDDWLTLRDMHYKTRKPLPFVGLGIFGEPGTSETGTPEDNMSKQSDDAEATLRKNAKAQKQQHVNMNLVVEDY